LAITEKKGRGKTMRKKRKEKKRKKSGTSTSIQEEQDWLFPQRYFRSAHYFPEFWRMFERV